MIIELISKSGLTIILNDRSTFFGYLSVLKSQVAKTELKLAIFDNINGLFRDIDTRKRLTSDKLIHDLSEICLSTCTASN